MDPDAKPTFLVELKDREGDAMPMGEVAPERISVVNYYRTAMEGCDSLAEENAKRAALQEGRAAKNLGLED